MQHCFINRIKLTLLPIFYLALAFPSVALAQTGTQGLTVIPPKFELFGNPGEILTEQVRLRNESDLPITYNVIIEDFSTSGEEGEVNLEGDTPDPNFSLASWITATDTVFLMDAKAERTFSFNVTIPKDAEPGGHYASLLFSTSGDAVPGAASVQSRVGTLVLLRVSGNVNETAQIETFEVPSYLQSGPVTFSLRIKNEGNVHIRPKGTIILTNLLGQKAGEIPLQGANVLPSAIRKMDTEWDKANAFGVYTATLVATYGQQNLPLTAAARFTIASPLALGVLGVGSLALIIIFFSLISGRKKLKQALRILTE
jgi:hypothetical protein